MYNFRKLFFREDYFIVISVLFFFEDDRTNDGHIWNFTLIYNGEGIEKYLIAVIVVVCAIYELFVFLSPNHPGNILRIYPNF